jgi:ketosteroid isomerase-like protein
MRLNACLVLLSVAAVSALPRHTATAQSAGVEQVLLKLERDWEQANAKNDVAALERILAPEFTSTDSDGKVTTRAEIFAKRRAGQVSFTAFTQDDYKVTVLGDAAIVTGRMTINATRDGKSWSGQERFTDVFVRRAGQWQAVASHASRVAQP